MSSVSLFFPGGGCQYLSPGLKRVGAEEHPGPNPLLFPIPHEPGMEKRKGKTAEWGRKVRQKLRAVSESIQEGVLNSVCVSVCVCVRYTRKCVYFKDSIGRPHHQPCGLHCHPQATRPDMIRILSAALHVVLRRDMSLNRRLYAWLLGARYAYTPSQASYWHCILPGFTLKVRCFWDCWIQIKEVIGFV